MKMSWLSKLNFLFVLNKTIDAKMNERLRAQHTDIATWQEEVSSIFTLVIYTFFSWTYESFRLSKDL